MIKVDIVPLKEIEKKYDEYANNLKNSHDKEWNDEIHDSFLDYVALIKNNSEIIHELRCKMEILIKEIEQTNMDNAIDETLALCKEINEL